MKKTLLSLSMFALLQLAANAQAPLGFNYQGIARTSTGAPLGSKPLGVRISIHDGSAAGAVVYQETQTATTNPYGLYNLTIGSGTAVVGTLAGVDWAAGSKYIQVEMDAAGGSSYADMGTSQLMSVPYAMAAASAPAPMLTISNDTISAGGNKIKLPAAANNLAGDVNGTLAAASVTKIQGTSVSATAPTSGQVMKYNGSAWAGAADIDAQTLSITGNSLSVSGGNSVTLPSYTAGTGVTVSSGNVISVNNLAGDVTGAPNALTVAKIQGTAVTNTAPTSGQVLKYNGTAYAPAADLGITSTAGTNYLPKTTGTGTVGNSSVYEANSRIGINNNTPQLDLDIVADSFGIRNSAPWDNLWFHVDGDMASINANGAGAGLVFRVGNNGGSFSGGVTYNNSASTLDTVMTMMPSGKVGINTMAPNSMLHVAGSMSLPIYTATANYTATDNDYTILCRSSLSPYTITLPSASGVAGRIYVVRRAPLIATNTISVITVTSTSGINGPAGSLTSYSMSGNNALTLQSDGSSWYVIGQM